VKSIVVCVVGVASLAAAGLVGAQVTPRPSLDIVDSRPLVVRGNGFKANERVVVVLFAVGRRWIRATETTDAGSFTARFPVAMPRCRGFTLQAFGSRGSRARRLSRLHTYCEPETPDTIPGTTRREPPSATLVSS
jgi:hypothetical protein